MKKRIATVAAAVMLAFASLGGAATSAHAAEPQGYAKPSQFCQFFGLCP